MSSDQEEVMTNPSGWLLDTYGKERVDDKYKGGCIFVDHASEYVHVELQSKLNTHETLRAKVDFEKACTEHGVVPQSYITDKSSLFTSQEYVELLSDYS